MPNDLLVCTYRKNENAFRLIVYLRNLEFLIIMGDMLCIKYCWNQIKLACIIFDCYILDAWLRQETQAKCVMQANDRIYGIKRCNLDVKLGNMFNFSTKFKI